MSSIRLTSESRLACWRLVLVTFSGGSPRFGAFCRNYVKGAVSALDMDGGRERPDPGKNLPPNAQSNIVCTQSK